MLRNGTLQRMQVHRIIRSLLVMCALISVTGCGTVSYYSQAVGGHLKLMSARQPISGLLADDATDDALRQKLQTLVDARSFAVNTLKLPDNDSYSSYVATGKRYVTWNVVAAEEFSVQAQTWCFPVAGCVSYRGYFDEQDARDYAARLASDNLDVNVGGATAYSTLGWFDDPVLDTMLNGGDIGYVSTLFHELAHQVLYVKDDSNFNEAFASFVEQQGIRLWLEARGETGRIERYDDYLQRNADFTRLLKQTREELQALYASSMPVASMRTAKQDVFDGMKKRYGELKQQWGGYAGYDGWFARELNNARLVSVATYRRYIPAFTSMFIEAGEDLESFYALATSVSRQSHSERRETMESYLAAGS